MLGRNVPFLSKLSMIILLIVLLGQLNNKMLYKVLHAGMKGASVATTKNQHTLPPPPTHTHNSGILGIWEIKCTKYLFCTERGHYSFLYIFNYFQISYCTYCTCIYLYSDFSSLFCLSIGLRGRI